MSKVLKITYKDGVHHVSGPLEDRSDLSVLKGAEGPIRLDLSGIGNLSSLGIRHLLEVINGWGGKKVEFVDVSVSFMMALNLLPALGMQGSKKIALKALAIPYRCSKCKKTVDVRATAASLVPDGKTLKEPNAPCPSCKTAMECEDDLRDYLQHLFP